MSQNQHTMNQNQHTMNQNRLTMNQNPPTMSQNRPTVSLRSMTTQNLATLSLLTGPPWKKSSECTQRTIPIQNQHTMSLPLPTTRLSQHITHLSRPMLHPNPSLLRLFLASNLMQPPTTRPSQHIT